MLPGTYAAHRCAGELFSRGGDKIKSYQVFYRSYFVQRYQKYKTDLDAAVLEVGGFELK